MVYSELITCQAPREVRRPVYKRSVSRLFKLLFFGILYNHAWGTGIPLSFSGIRYASVLGRIGISWFVAAWLAWHTEVWAQVLIGASILALYTILQLAVPVPGYGAGVLTPDGSINSYVDQLLLPGITYQAKPFDPEGILSILPSIVNCMSGVWAGRFLVTEHVAWIPQGPRKGPLTRAAVLFAVGLCVLGTGWLFHLAGYPINKPIWTTPFTFVTAGWSCLFFSAFHVIFDIFKLPYIGFPFIIIGLNSIVLYLLTAIFDWNYAALSVFGGLVAAASTNWAVVIKTLALVAVQWIFGFMLYKRGVFFRV